MLVGPKHSPCGSHFGSACWPRSIASRYEARSDYAMRASSSGGVTVFTGDFLKPLLSRVTR